MIIPYYAHSVENCPDQDWEPLARHLAEVRDDAGALGHLFAAREFAALAGLLHDLGKYGPDFQARLRDPNRRADHSTIGAVWAFERVPKWGRLIAHVVAGHHAGLKDDLLGAGGRIKGKASLLPEIERIARADGIVLPDSGPARLAMKPGDKEAGFQLAFLTRMLFSCLVDADRTAAARFDARSRGEADTPPVSPSLQTLEAALHTGMARWPASQDPPETTRGRLNSLRATVLRDAIEAAERPQGVFTLTVPTGGGKTLSSLAFALAHARRHGLDRVIVVIPFTSIIEQTAAAYREVLGPEFEDAVLEHHSAFERTDEADGRRLRRRGGEQTEGVEPERVGPERLRLSMERWDRPIVVTTAVQFFESLFSSRTSRCRKLHSLARSVVVLDEAQTMPLPLLRPCVAALKELARNYGATVVLCTATQPALDAPHPGHPDAAGAQGGFPGGFEDTREIASNVPALFAGLRRVTLRDIGMQDDVALADLMAAQPQSLCIVNQRAHARALFAAVRSLEGARHLSTCMHSVHRARVLAGIRDDLAHRRPCRVVSTSLVEAGVDVDFPLVLRATAGLDQIAQAAGRCNREFDRTPEQSEVLLFRAAEHGVIRALVAQAECGAEVLDTHRGDPFAPDAMRAYFDMLYWRRGQAELDRSGVLSMCEVHKGDLNFPFESISAAMRFIDDAMVPVIVPCEERKPGLVEALVRSLPFAKGVGGIARQLGPYTVGVPRQVRAAMIAARVAEAVGGEELGDQFVVLRNLDLYTAEAGLDWSDPTFRRGEGLIV